MNVAILDDYQNVALRNVDWSGVRRCKGETRGLIGAPEFALMKPTARFVNTLGGPIVDEAALVEALQTRQIAGATVDVFDVEPLPLDRPFRKRDDVLATPHIGYVTEDLHHTFYADAAANVATWLEANAAVR